MDLIHYVGDVYKNSSLTNTIINKGKLIYKDSGNTFLYWEISGHYNRWFPFWIKL